MISPKMTEQIKTNKTLQELIIGIILYAVPVEAVIFFITSDKVYNSAGFFIGTVVALICAMHMAYCIEIAVKLSEKDAMAYSRAKTVLRYGIICIALIVSGYFKMANPVTMIFGFLGLKFGAYLNPLVRKMLGRTDETELDVSGDDNNLE